MLNRIDADRIMDAVGHKPFVLERREIEGVLVHPVMCKHNKCRAIYTFDPFTNEVIGMIGVDLPCPYEG